MIGRAILPSPFGQGGDLRRRIGERHREQERADGDAQGPFANAECDARPDRAPGITRA